MKKRSQLPTEKKVTIQGFCGGRFLVFLLFLEARVVTFLVVCLKESSECFFGETLLPGSTGVMQEAPQHIWVDLRIFFHASFEC